MISKTRAEALLSEIRDSITNIQKRIAEFVSADGWKALGYDSLLECWQDRLADVPVTWADTQGIVVAKMVEQGETDIEIARAVSGVGGVVVRRMREQLDDGVAPDMLRVEKREVIQERDLHNASPRTVHIPLPLGTYQRYLALARREGVTLQSEAEVALRLHFAELAARHAE